MGKHKSLWSREEKIEWIVRWAQAHEGEEIKRLVSQYRSAGQARSANPNPCRSR